MDMHDTWRSLSRCARVRNIVGYGLVSKTCHKEEQRVPFENRSLISSCGKPSNRRFFSYRWFPDFCVRAISLPRLPDGISTATVIADFNCTELKLWAYYRSPILSTSSLYPPPFFFPLLFFVWKKALESPDGKGCAKDPISPRREWLVDFQLPKASYRRESQWNRNKTWSTWHSCQSWIEKSPRFLSQFSVLREIRSRNPPVFFLSSPSRRAFKLALSHWIIGR